MNDPPQKQYKHYWRQPILHLPYPFGFPCFTPEDMEKLINILKVLTVKRQKYIVLVLPLHIRWGAVFGESTKRENLDGATRNSKQGKAAFTYRVSTLYSKLYEGGYIQQSLREFSFDSQAAVREVNEMFAMFEGEE